jgi:SRSO17 transposase
VEDARDVWYVEAMTPKTLKALKPHWEHFLRDLTEPMRRRERRHWVQVYIQGLLLDGARKSIEPIAGRIAGADVQALRKFVGHRPWAVAAVQRRLARKVVELLNNSDVWIINETTFPKAGVHSVGVAQQFWGTLGKVANCQVAERALEWCRGQLSAQLAAVSAQRLDRRSAPGCLSETAAWHSIPK